MRLIDADELVKRARPIENFPKGTMVVVLGVVKSLPTVDAEPIRHGKWKEIPEPTGNDMERYVDVDWLIADLGLKDHVPLEDEDAWAVIDWLNKFPTVDIVRCKECIHDDNCRIQDYLWADDDFCSRGERK